MLCGWECHAFHVGLGHVCTLYIHVPLLSRTILFCSSLIFFFFILFLLVWSSTHTKMALQAPSLHTVPTVNAGLRRPSMMNPFTLKSSFSFSGSINLYLHPNHHHLTSAPPRISMRVASKQAYICRDCGLPFIIFFLFSFSI